MATDNEVQDVIVKTVGRSLFTWAAAVVLSVSGGEALAQGAGVIAGRVTEGGDCPRPGVRIEAVGGADGDVRRFGVSDREGRFRIDGLPESVYAVFPDLDAFRERERRQVDPRREQSVDFQLDHTLYGTVTLDGQRVGGRTVEVQLDNCDPGQCRCVRGRRSDATEMDGSYRIENLPFGTYRVSIPGEEVHASDASVVLEDRKRISNEIALTSAPGPVSAGPPVETSTWAR